MSNGYIQADVLGRTRGLKFGALAAENIILEIAQLGVAASNGNYSGAMMASIIWWGLQNNAYVKRETLDLSFEEVVDWVDEHFTSDNELAPVFTAIARTWEESKASKMVLEHLQKTLEEIKKKESSPSQGPTLTPLTGGST